MSKTTSVDQLTSDLAAVSKQRDDYKLDAELRLGTITVLRNERDQARFDNARLIAESLIEQEATCDYRAAWIRAAKDCEMVIDLCGDADSKNESEHPAFDAAKAMQAELTKAKALLKEACEDHMSDQHDDRSWNRDVREFRNKCRAAGVEVVV